MLSESEKVTIMATNYNKLWKLQIDRGMIKKDLRIQARTATGK